MDLSIGGAGIGINLLKGRSAILNFGGPGTVDAGAVKRKAMDEQRKFATAVADGRLAVA